MAGSDFLRGFLLTDLVGIRAIETPSRQIVKQKNYGPGTRSCLNRLLITRGKRPKLIPKLTQKRIAARSIRRESVQASVARMGKPTW